MQYNLQFCLKNHKVHESTKFNKKIPCIQMYFSWKHEIRLTLIYFLDCLDLDSYISPERINRVSRKRTVYLTLTIDTSLRETRVGCCVKYLLKDLINYYRYRSRKSDRLWWNGFRFLIDGRCKRYVFQLIGWPCCRTINIRLCTNHLVQGKVNTTVTTTGFDVFVT